MVLEERKNLDCAGIYKQTQLKLDAQLKLLTKLEATAAIGSQTVASLTETTTILGQKRREFCELYKVTPEFAKDDYFRVYGELDKGESDLEVVFRHVTAKEPPDPRSVDSQLSEIRQGVTKITEQVALLAEERKPRHLTEKQRAALVNQLSKQAKAKLVLHASIATPEAQQFADELASALRDAGWTVDFKRALFSGGSNYGRGLWISVRDAKSAPVSAILLQKALTGIGLEARVQVKESVPDGEFWLSVGTK